MQDEDERVVTYRTFPRLGGCHEDPARNAIVEPIGGEADKRGDEAPGSASPDH